MPHFEIIAKINLRIKPGSPALEPSQIELIEDEFVRVRASVRLSRKFRTVQKEIRSVSCFSSNNGEVIELKVHCDGGIPIKKLVTGQDDTVRPNLARYLSSYEIDQERPFDITGVKIKDEQVSRPKSSGNFDSALNDQDYE